MKYFLIRAGVESDAKTEKVCSLFAYSVPFMLFEEEGEVSLLERFFGKVSWAACSMECLKSSSYC